MFCSLLKRSLDETHAVRALMRSMYFSNGTIDGFLKTATAGQVSAVRGLIASELELRDRRKRERLVRKARFPQVKSFEGYDFSQVALPEGYGVDDLRSLGFVEHAEDFVFHVSVNIIFTIFTNVFSPIAPTRMRRIRQRGCAAFGA